MTDKTKLEKIIQELEWMQKVLYSARPQDLTKPDCDLDCSYPYAVGYCKVGLSHTIQDLKNLHGI